MAFPSPASPLVDLDRRRVQRWRRSWDDLMTCFLPGLRDFENALRAAAEAACAGPPDCVLDLGGGPGLMAERLATRWPEAAVRLLDLDPVLLSLAASGAPGRITVHPGDLAESSWAAEIAQDGPVDLVAVVMTMHYLPEARVRALYRDARSVLRPGGLLVIADRMPNGDVPSVMNTLHPVADEAAAGLAWTRWWDEIGAEPALGPLMRHRATLFAGRVPAEFAPDEQWHRAAADDAGFRESGVIWRQGIHAAVSAVA